MRVRVVPELLDQGMTVERRLDDPPLHPCPAAVNHPNLAEPGGIRRGHVLLDDRRDVAWLEGVQIENAVDGQAEGVVQGFSQVAVTTVLIPPRTLKSPVTVIRRGWHAATRSSRIWLVTCS